jgi:AsmA family protein
VTRQRGLKLLGWIGVPVALIVAVVSLWNWDWFVPLVASRASASIDRPVTIEHLHVRLRRVSTFEVDGITIANPTNWPEGPPLARIQRFIVRVDLVRYLFHHQLVVRLVEIDRPQVEAEETADGNANFRLSIAGSSGSGTKIDALRIIDGQAHVVVPKLRANFNVALSTREEPGQTPELVAEAHGTYAGQPIVAQMVGGAILALRDPNHPWPIDLRVRNGPTRVQLVGSVRDPMALAGADLQLRLAGPDMSRLTPLTGLPIPGTPPYQVAGRLDFANRRVTLHEIEGRVGSSDLEGDIDVDPGDIAADNSQAGVRPVMTADLRSRSVDLADLGEFVGTKPAPGTNPAAKKVLPTEPIHVPKLRFADVHLRYRAGRIQGRSMPLDNVAVALDIVNGNIDVHPLGFGVGTGRISLTAQLVDSGNTLRTRAEINFQSVDVSRLMAATHMFHGAGTISGSGRIDTSGNSIGQMAANGNGEIAVGMSGGDVSAILVDLSGLEFGNALLSALGMPRNAIVECMIGDFALERGVMRTRALILDTQEAILTGTGAVNWGTERLDLRLQTRPRHFSIGSLPGPINIGGTLKHPSIMPGSETVVRGGLAVGLGVVFAPLAVLPMIQFGSSDHGACAQMLTDARQKSPGTKPPAPRKTRSTR